MADRMPLRPVAVVWEDDPDASCEWCGKETHNTWVISAAPMSHEKFCSPKCVAQDTALCWEPNETCVMPFWISDGA